MRTARTARNFAAAGINFTVERYDLEPLIVLAVQSFRRVHIVDDNGSPEQRLNKRKELRFAFDKVGGYAETTLFAKCGHIFAGKRTRTA